MGATLLAGAANAQEGPGATAFTRIEAARSTWQGDSPPAAGWVPVKLPDDWSSRWPDFDGVVWYRLSWQCADASQPTALMLAYLNMAGAVYLNGSLLMRDASLVEPLTRAWNTPRYQLISPPLLREGTNTLLIRVSGLSAYQPGLGPVSVADPDRLRAAYEQAYRLRHDLQLVSLAITVALGCFFFSLWVMRRQEVTYGWFSLMSLAWWWVALNQVATSTWPFASTDAWGRANIIALLIYSAAFTMSMVRFCERRLPRIEAVLWTLVVLGAAVMLGAPHGYLTDVRNTLTVGLACNFFATCLVFLCFAGRSGRTDHRILSFCIAIFLVAAVHDLLSFLGILKDNLYYAALTSQFQMIAMALVLAWRFVANLRRIERFNDELHCKIDAAKAELAANLDRQREFEVANARLSERLNLAHDLHDGLGGTLVSGIATLERIPHDIPPGQVLSILKELRDDLRIIIDTTSSQQFGEHALAGQIVPLRHRLTRLFESHDIECRWQLTGLDQCYLPTSQILDVMRTLQEALTNVLKHSKASRADVVLRNDARGLELVVSDNGMGFEPAAIERHPGTGMRSMRARTRRLGGTLSVRSTGEGTMLTVRIPIAADTLGSPLDLQPGRSSDRVPDPGITPRGPKPAGFAIETDPPVQGQG
ncbi:Signal transduction histidine kinase [Cupriavidus necator]|uniref:histidine kinase n=1 Tax=Cupriavidus necator (strain ATCC 17699 / DSM 428 / KCTC 22496 / NCIMB 10442 / H16 / Stanier 337) TaxID=381666 RepID=Q0K3K5_CUPNH|nr:7TM diverse intracellular signaling domain-containing protein [Cupriavidus necator]WKA44658.1 7TM diverse intracellular signaling domain-containing protein [Cupriavidus necator]CAJ95419.1 signal transduction histidine kinase [Cupriavidus necator H16]